jgi:hypothetical protein
MRRPTILALSLLALASAGDAAFAQKRGDRSLITQQDLDEAKGSITTALEAVQRLRPNWLNPSRGRNASATLGEPIGTRSANATEPIVYIDERRQPAVDALRTVTVASLVEIKYMDQNKAVQMLGPGHEAGAILISTDRSKK